MDEHGKEEKMQQRESGICRSFSGTLFLGENVAPATGFVLFQEKRGTMNNQVLSMIVAIFWRFRSVLDPT